MNWTAGEQTTTAPRISYRMNSFLRRNRWWFFLLLLLSMVAATQSVAAQTENTDGITLEAEAGFDGIARQNDWLPVTVNVANSGPSVAGEIRVLLQGSGAGELIYSTPLALPNQSNKQVTLPVFFPAFLGRDLVVQLVDETGRPVIETSVAPQLQLNQDDRLYGVVSDAPADLDFLENVTGPRSRAAVAYLAVDDIPETGAALDPLDVLVFTNVDSGRLNDRQLAAIRDWVATGGQLIVTGGLTGPQTSAALGPLLPVTTGGSRPVDDLPELRQAAGVEFRDPGPYVLTEASLTQGEALLLHEFTPVLARRPLGKGSVTYLALDPNVAPLLDWAGNETFWATVAPPDQPRPVWASGPQQNYSAANAVSELPSLGLPPVYLLICFLGLYVVIIGPANYLVLKRLNRRELAWLTIPVLVLFFSAVAYATGVVFAGNNVTINEVAVVYGEAGSEQGKVNSLLALYSPQRGRYDLALPGDTLVRPFDRNEGNLAGFGNLEAVSRSDAVNLQGVQVDVSGIEMFIADSYQPLPAVTGRVDLRLEGTTNELDISLQNNGDFTLEDAGLLIGSTYIRLGDLEPGDLLERSEALSAAQFSGSGSTFVPGSGFSLERHYPAILGTSTYYDDPEVYTRWQLLDSLNDYNAGRTAVLPAGTVTLLAWSDAPQLAVELAGEEPEKLATTAYFLELPVSETIGSAGQFVLPVELLSWQILGENGIYGADIVNFHLPPGWIEYEYTPWPEFSGMAVENLAIVLNEQFNAGNPAPGIRLWDWEQQDWVIQPGLTWGTNRIADYERYVAAGNQVRLRLDNNTGRGLDIAEVYPQLTGRMP
jgi:hypothetical protein